jgi:hypothetical protein
MVPCIINQYCNVQRDATMSSQHIILLQYHSTCFGCPLHPSSWVSCTPDDGRKGQPKHVEWYCSQIKYRLLTVASRWTLQYRCMKYRVTNVRTNPNPRPAYVGSAVYKVTTGRFYSWYFGFPTSVPFHQCSTRIFYLSTNNAIHILSKFQVSSNNTPLSPSSGRYGPAQKTRERTEYENKWAAWIKTTVVQSAPKHVGWLANVHCATLPPNQLVVPDSFLFRSCSAII